MDLVGLPTEMSLNTPCVPGDFFPLLVLLMEDSLSIGNTSRINNTY